ncbi:MULTISPECIES: helix-turn-helix transcriptional regulator [unclassified Chelatococcus]|uniref:helix-turn-helix domain-containing protein n=1 Tax=unclassified Chelatococcus TaxID=2638111 RepID=UPI001BCF9B7A|nr:MULTISPECIES: helix-turn-helix transcriptional regulator [unclassified Chelatococcus]MBS7701491.1 helix-turn-helix transcriptional regulator [Chelatococcus sp. YT9]MBX3559221.1 helix-turn-helix transcriptional regulator [Chelatococcus sp.]
MIDNGVAHTGDEKTMALNKLTSARTGTAAPAASKEVEIPEIAVFLDKAIERALREGNTSQAEIARAVGYKSPNVISMFKSGAMKVPLDKVGVLAEVLNVDPMHLFRLALAQFALDISLWEKLQTGVLSQNEKKILSHIRKVTNNTDPKPTPAILAGIKKAFEGRSSL